MKSSLITAACVVVILTVWMASGLLNDDSADAQEVVAERAETLMKVEIARVSLSTIDREIVLQGQLDPWRDVEIRAEMSGTVAALPVDKGSRVRAGATLISLDPGTLEADLLEARARVQSARSEEQAAAALQRQGLQSQIQFEQLKAQLETARAQLSRAERALTLTEILAPFDGAVNRLAVELGEWVQIGDPVAHIVDDTQLRAAAQVAQQDVAQLEIGQRVDVMLLTGESLSGSLSYISPLADANTRSFRIEARVDNPQLALAAGVSATLTVPVEQVQAAFISPSVLALDDAGKLGVKLIGENERVTFQAVRLLRSELDGTWVAGIPDGARLITLGHGFVSEGEQVDSVTAQIGTSGTAP